ncbi:MULTISPECIES: DNA cytosine methyltransferase [unclassified Rhizobium]|uniref:DNA cytosine methyltransferase n=1 Tax=unclassified Rhizobium TaxID=2613769 RepID=UPI0009E6BFE4
MSRGLIDAGIDVVRAYDAWPVAVETYRKNIGPHAEVADLKNLLSVVPEICRLAPDLICGGPPCQDYSLAGGRKEGENASMTIAFAIAVTAVRPQWFVMENVIQARSSRAWAEAKAMLERAGYGLSESKINAAQYGVPQNRRRLFVIGRLGERNGFLQSAIAAAASAKPVTLRDFFKPHPADAALLENGFVYCRPLRDGRGVRSIDEPIHTISRTSWERPTVRYLSAPHPKDPVPASAAAILTVDQISRLQGFPENWRWVASVKQDRMQMIANAVPGPVAKALGGVILARQAGQSIPGIEGRFLDWLTRGGRTRATSRNIKANANRARRLLGGRTFADVNIEITALEALEDFQVLSKGTRSDLRQALRLHDEFVASKTRKRMRTKAECESVNVPAVDLNLEKAA